jgi:hypothetical protein
VYGDAGAHVTCFLLSQKACFTGTKSTKTAEWLRDAGAAAEDAGMATPALLLVYY